MKSILTLLAVLILSFSTYAQEPYALFSHDSLKYASEQFEFPIVKDAEFVIGNITYFHLAPTYNFDLDNPYDEAFESFEIDSISSNSFNWERSNWLGNEIRVDSMGNYILENRAEDIFEIRTKANLSEYWTLVEFENGDYITAIVDSIVVGNMMESADTTKHIGLLKKDSTGTTVLDDINGSQIIIGQNSGLISSPGFFEYPYKFQQYYFVGGIHDVLPIEETNRYKVWNMDVGDEFHVEYDNELLFGTQKLKIIITDKSWNSQIQNFTYTKHITNESYGPIFDEDSNIVDYGVGLYESDIVQEVNLNNYKFLDGELLGMDLYNSFYNYFDSNISKQYAKAKFNDNLFQISNQFHGYELISMEWYNPPYSDNSDPFYFEYIEGCGGAYQYIVFPILGEDYDTYRLKYYKKGDQTWGNPYNIGLEELEANSISLFPNPTSGDVYLDLGKLYDDISIRIMNINGQVISQGEFQNQQSLDLNLKGSPGYYFIEVILDNVSVITKRVVKY